MEFLGGDVSNSALPPLTFVIVLTSNKQTLFIFLSKT